MKIDSGLILAVLIILGAIGAFWSWGIARSAKDREEDQGAKHAKQRQDLRDGKVYQRFNRNTREDDYIRRRLKYWKM